MTRAALRILDRARSSAWRRVGMPTSWKTPPPAKPEGGKNVAGETADHAGTGRTDAEPESVTPDKEDR